MKKAFRIFFALFFLVGFIPASPAYAQVENEITPDPNCVLMDSLPQILVCIPDPLLGYPEWNGDLIVYAHGYVDPNLPVQIPEDQMMLEGQPIWRIVNKLGYAFATTSYRANGLVVLDAVQDIRDLVNQFWGTQPRGRTFLVGVSEGGLVTALAVERYPAEFSGGMPMCGPVGDFRKQINYWGDFRAAFDYFFKGVLPPSAVKIPQEVMDYWSNPMPTDETFTYEGAVINAILGNSSATQQLLNVTGAAIDPGDPISSTVQTVTGVLRYNIFATNNGVEVLGGSPFDNWSKYYFGSLNDRLLNKKIDRYKADKTALKNLAAYNTTGSLQIPLVTLHTTGDEIVPYWHETLYNIKIIASGSLMKHLNIPIIRYGHCNFTASEVVSGFAALTWMASTTPLANWQQALESPEAQQDFLNITSELEIPIE